MQLAHYDAVDFADRIIRNASGVFFGDAPYSGASAQDYLGI